MNIPKQMPEPLMGGFDMQYSEFSHLPEKPPGPPQASPNVFAHTLQHLEKYTKKKKIINDILTCIFCSL